MGGSGGGVSFIHSGYPILATGTPLLLWILLRQSVYCRALEAYPMSGSLGGYFHPLMTPPRLQREHGLRWPLFSAEPNKGRSWDDQSVANDGCPDKSLYMGAQDAPLSLISEHGTRGPLATTTVGSGTTNLPSFLATQESSRRGVVAPIKKSGKKGCVDRFISWCPGGEAGVTR